jgi:hypothetical protein
MKKLTKIQESARGEECTIRIAGICNHDPSTVVLCHAPYPGKSGTRTHDWWAAYGCSSCHDAVDGRARMNYDLSLFWLPAIHETQQRLMEKGLIVIVGEDAPVNKILPRR